MLDRRDELGLTGAPSLCFHDSCVCLPSAAQVVHGCRRKGAYGVARDGASATLAPADQPSKTAATKGRDRSARWSGTGRVRHEMPPTTAATSASSTRPRPTVVTAHHDDLPPPRSSATGAAMAGTSEQPHGAPAPTGSHAIGKSAHR